MPAGHNAELARTEKLAKFAGRHFDRTRLAEATSKA
jgi:hypothetical protein